MPSALLAAGSDVEFVNWCINIDTNVLCFSSVMILACVCVCYYLWMVVLFVIGVCVCVCVCVHMKDQIRMSVSDTDTLSHALMMRRRNGVIAYDSKYPTRSTSQV